VGSIAGFALDFILMDLQDVPAVAEKDLQVSIVDAGCCPAANERV